MCIRDSTISGNLASGEDVLSFTPQFGITGTFNATTGVLSLGGQASLTQYETVLRSVTYQNTSDNPSELTRTIDFVVNDGQDDSITLSRNVEITTENDPPILSNFANDNPDVLAILNANPSLHYDQGTGKFYQISTTVATSLSNATTLSNNNLLNGVPGQLANIRCLLYTSDAADE